MHEASEGGDGNKHEATKHVDLDNPRKRGNVAHFGAEFEEREHPGYCGIHVPECPPTVEERDPDSETQLGDQVEEQEPVGERGRNSDAWIQ